MDTQVEPVISNNNHSNEGTVFSSILSLSNTIIGTGILSLPFTLSNTGITLGILFFVFSAYVTKLSLCFYIDVAKIIAPNKYDIKISNLSEMINMPKFGVFTNVAIILNCFGTATSLLIASSDFISSLFRNLLSDDYTGILLDNRFWITVEIIIVIPIVFRKSLASLKFFSLFSIFSISYLAFSIIFSYFVLKNEKPSSNPSSIEPLIEQEAEVGFIRGILRKFMSVAIIIFAYGCQQNIFPIYSELKPAHRPYISHIIFYAVFFCTIIYLIIGYCGYATFGNKVLSNILNNYEDSNVIINIARLAMAIYCTFTYSVQMHPCRESIKKEIISYKIRHQKDYEGGNEENQEEKDRLLSDQEQNYGSTSGLYSGQASHQNQNKSISNSNNNSKNSNSSNNSSNNISYTDDDEEFESQIDGNDADDERSCDSRQIKHINIDILDNITCPVNNNIDNINEYDNETLFNSITIGLLISSYLVAMICDDFGKILSLVGASCTTTITFIIPGYLYAKITRGFTFKRIEAIILFILGIIIAIVGSVASLS